ncbi:MAG: tetratricopeptide repeat protein [Bacteroidales bacterium]|nr:tetratricopeptide repeat protein [Bacteroidales bacterium]
MDYKEVINKHSHISQLILNNEILVAIEELYIFANQTKRQYHHNKIEKIKDTYKNILKHSFSGIEDPSRDNIYNYVRRTLLEILDSIKECVLTESSDLRIYKLKWSLEKNSDLQTDEAYSLITNLTFDSELDKILKDNKIDIVNKTETEVISRQESLKELFNFLWLTDHYKETEDKTLETICYSDKIPWHDKSLIVSAITLSLIRIFDVNKFKSLLKFYTVKENQVWQRALIGLVIGIFRYDKKIGLYPDLEKELSKLSKSEEIDKEIESIIIQIFKSKDTEKITKKWEEEILPEMRKIQPKIEENLDLENIVEDKFLEDKNPDWEKVFEDSPDLFDKLQDFSQMQIEGSDVFMSAFSKLKNFPFFNEFSNWFAPFYKENEYIDLIFEKEETNLQPFVEQIEKSFHMCNSDKYSFCLNLQMIPESHKSMMMEMFNEEMKSMEEVAKDENLFNSFAATKNIFTQYLQDLYRFFKLHPYKNEFSDFFKWEFDIQNASIFNKIITNKQVTRNIAEFFLENQHFAQAVGLFKFIEQSEEGNIELFEKIGYCFQRIGDYKEALGYYKKAELLDSNKVWIIKKIALCHRYLDDHNKALLYYKEAEKFEQDNLYIQAYIGHTLMRLERYEEALKYYFKVEYLDPSNDKIQRPIAWVSLILGKFETAIKYFHRIPTEDLSAKDYMQIAISYWCLSDMNNTKEYYNKALAKLKNKFNEFSEYFDDDIQILLDNGINRLDICLMKDYILDTTKY